MVGDFYIGRGSRERGLEKSLYSNDYKVAQFGRERAISCFAQKLRSDEELRSKLWTLSGLRLICHCKPSQACHADSIIDEFRRMYPSAHDREDSDADPPKSEVLHYLARLRMFPAPEDDSSADEEVPEKGTGWRGTSPPMSVGLGYAAPEHCDGHSLASPGRWPSPQRRYPETPLWTEISKCYMRLAEVRGTPQLLIELALGKVKSCPFSEDEIQALKRETTEVMQKLVIKIYWTSEDRTDIPIDYRYLDAMLDQLDTQKCRWVRSQLGPGLVRESRCRDCPHCMSRREGGGYGTRQTQLHWKEERTAEHGVWRRNYSTMAEWSEECVKIMNDQAERGQVLRLSEEEAQRRFSCLTVASLGAQKKKKKKPGGEVTARILFEGTHGIDVNTRIRIRDQERAPIAADVKRVLRERAKQG